MCRLIAAVRFFTERERLCEREWHDETLLEITRHSLGVCILADSLNSRGFISVRDRMSRTCFCGAQLHAEAGGRADEDDDKHVVF